ncbi:MAG: hypothetical protein HYZ15_16015 [Sphingobacteriales bacterium]|nr:hypothetical protein [Sphingobacteriales bacterium]
MKKIFIGLLVIAAGAVVYFLLIQKKKSNEQVLLNRELILGKWETEGRLTGTDSLKTYYQYEFQQDGLALIADTAASKTDSFRYEWNKTGQLLVRDNAADSTADLFTVIRLTSDSLQLKRADSLVQTFTRK